MSVSPRPTGQRGLAWLRRYTWWFLVPFPLIAAILGAVQAIEYDHPSWTLVAVLAAFGFATLMGGRWFDAATKGETKPAPGIADWLGIGLAAAGLAATAWLVAPFPYRPLGWLLLASGLAAAVVLRQPPRRRLIALLATTALITAVSWLLVAFAGAGPQTLTLGPAIAASFTAILWTQWWTFDVARRLEWARATAAELAVAQERLRFAAELHDIQGHHLQVIALKSELAARLSPKRPEAGVALMREVQGLARDALSDTRAVVAGYRRVSVRTEINNAVKVLTAAGIRASARLPEDDPRWSGELERELGLLIREATTNVLRHAKPDRADFELAATPDAITLRIHNDGAEAAGPEDTARRPGSPEAEGTGLTALRERVAAAGGSLDWRRDGARFTVSATLPLTGGTQPEGAV